MWSLTLNSCQIHLVFHASVPNLTLIHEYAHHFLTLMIPMVSHSSRLGELNLGRVEATILEWGVVHTPLECSKASGLQCLDQTWLTNKVELLDPPNDINSKTVSTHKCLEEIVSQHLPHAVFVEPAHHQGRVYFTLRKNADAIILQDHKFRNLLSSLQASSERIQDMNWGHAVKRSNCPPHWRVQMSHGMK